MIRSPGNGLQSLQRVRGDLLLVRGDRVHADGRQVAHRSSQTHGLGDRRRPGLEPVRRCGEGRAGHLDHLDHLAATEERRQLGQQVVATPQHADAGRADHLVPGEGDQVRTQLDHVDRQLRDGLRGVQHDRRADGVTQCDDLADRVDGAEHVGHVRHRDDLGALVHQSGGGGPGQIQPALVGHVEPAQGGAGPLREELPGHDVGVVLHHRDDDLVTGLQPRTQRVRAQVERLGGVLGEDHFLGTSRPR